nr:NADH dehydrogenase subunit 6 [Systropus sp. 2 YXA-2022a]
MMKWIILNMSFNTLMFIFTQTPMLMGLIILWQTMLICLLMGLMSKSFWFLYILFIVFIGGMMILFIYVTSLASNELLMINNNKMYKFLIMHLLLLIFMMMWDEYFNTNSTINLEKNNYFNWTLMYENTLILNKMYNFPTMYITFLMMIYLLLTLIVIVKITKIMDMPLRPMNN